MAAQAKPGVQERILLICGLFRFQRQHRGAVCSFADGIANAVAIARSNVPGHCRAQGPNILVERQAHVKGVSRKRKAYFLTDSGVSLASETWERLRMARRIILDDQPAIASTLGGAKGCSC